MFGADEHRLVEADQEKALVSPLKFTLGELGSNAGPQDKKFGRFSCSSVNFFNPVGDYLLLLLPR